MSDIYRFIGEKIRSLRLSYGGEGWSQDELAQRMKTTANTISRWETAAYKPSIVDLEKLAKLFSVPITAFFPEIEVSSNITALLSATGGLNNEDLEEIRDYAMFRKARMELKKEKAKPRRHP
jgi:transcriptional regulator with XRE-family HTH domain